MSESEAKTLSEGNDPNDTSPSQTPHARVVQAGVIAAVAGIAAPSSSLAAKFKPGKPAKVAKPKRPPKKRWPGTILEFTDWVIAERASGKIVARSDADAYRQACRDWKQSNGRKITPDSCRVIRAQAKGKADRILAENRKAAQKPRQ
jgi:hypothetical protein